MMHNLFEHQEWVGEFFTSQNEYANRFPGKASYSPEDGVILKYRITGDNIPDKTDALLGVLDNGEKCTLIGNFSPVLGGTQMDYGLVTRYGKNAFYSLVMGEFISEDALFEEAHFTLTNMQEFFFPKGYKSSVKVLDKPLFEVVTDYGTVAVVNSAQMGILDNDITSQIYSRNQAALNELKTAFDEIKTRHSDSNFWLKTDISYLIHIKLNKGTTIREIYNYISDLAALFALLTHKPVYPDNIGLTVTDNQGAARNLNVYPSLVMEVRTINLVRREKSHFEMPIRQGDIDLPSVIEKWLKTSKNYSTVISGIQHETGFRDEHSIHGEIVLYATQLESISNGAGKKKIKYEYPIDTYGSNHVRGSLEKIFSQSSTNSLGKNIGDLRDEIAHVGKPKKLLKVLSLKDMVHIGQYLQIVILAYILTNLGIQPKVIEEYRSRFSPTI